MTIRAGSLTEGTQALLLLYGRFSRDASEKPLDLRELNRLQAWLDEEGTGAGDLIDAGVEAVDVDAVRIERDRLAALLARGGALALAVEKWARAGIWITSRADDAYPARVKEHLGTGAPPLLFGAGDPDLMERGGLAIVGSRDVDSEGEDFTASVARQCAGHDVAVVSGGARGVDQIAIFSALEAGGRAIVALPEGLGKSAIASKYREGLREERVVLLSPYDPDAGFSVGNAMGRNKLIYALADASLVVATSLRKGGTWAGAEEELKRNGSRQVWVRMSDGVPKGNAALLELGAKPFPESLADPMELFTTPEQSGSSSVCGRAGRRESWPGAVEAFLNRGLELTAIGGRLRAGSRVSPGLSALDQVVPGRPRGS